ncbi:MAG: DMT family transporter [Micromonosporaceae bacterium]
MAPGSLVRLGILAVVWGSSFLWIAIGLRGFSPVQVTFGRVALGAVVLGVIVAWRRLTLPNEPMAWLHLAVAAMSANVIPWLLFAVGEQQVSSSVAGLLNGTTPLWTLLIVLATGDRQGMSTSRVAGLLLGFGGTLLIFSPWRAGSDVASWGGLACLVAAASYGASFVYADRYLVRRGLHPVVLAGCQLLISTVILGAATLISGPDLAPLRWDAAAAVVVLGIAGTGLALILYYRLITDVGPTASVVTYLLPVVALLLGAVVLSEPLTVPVVLGMVTVLAGVALVRRTPSDTEDDATEHAPRDGERVGT